MTLEPDGAATGCNPVQVGSTPTGVFFEGTIRPSQRRTVPCPHVRRLADAHLALSAADDARQALYREAQLALRAVIGARELDQFLADKDALAKELEVLVRQRVATLGLEVVSLGIRDVILPGDMKDLMNKVTEAKKAAEANLIVRREETAAMRSQANTAKVLEGNIGQVIAELREHQRQVGLPPKDCEKTDPRKVLADAVSYFQNHISRMEYPAYRRQGPPTTSALMESFVKEMNARVKGTEKFWNDGASGEAILQIRAAALCEDARLSNFLHSRPGHPFHPNVPRHPSLTTAS